MQVTETRAEGLSREFQIVVPASDLDTRLMKHIEGMKGQVNLKGFRPGKVPASYIKKAFGKSIMGEIIQETVKEVSDKALEDRELRPAQLPKIDIDGEVEPVIEGKSDLSFTMAVDVMPEFEPADVKQISVEKPVTEVTEEELDVAVKGLADQQKAFKPRGKTAKAKEEDQVTIDFEGKVDGELFDGGKGEDLPLVLGSGSFIPGFEDQLIGAKTGDDVTVNVTFPEDYPADNLAGKEAEFAVKVKEVGAPEAAAIDDELAKKLGLESLDQLKETLKGRMSRDLAQISRERLKRNLLDALDELHSFDLPPGMVTAEFDQIWGQVQADLAKEEKTFEDEGQTEDEARAEYQKIAQRRVRLGLVLAEIGRTNNIDVTEDELGRAINEQARQFPGQENQVYDFYKQNPQAVMQLRAPIFEDKVIDFISELATVTEKTVTREELLADPDEDSEDAAKETEKKPAPKKKKAAKKAKKDEAE